MKIERSDLMRILGVKYEALRSIERRGQLEGRLEAVGYRLLGKEVIGNNRVMYEVVPTTSYENFVESIEVYITIGVKQQVDLDGNSSIRRKIKISLE